MPLPCMIYLVGLLPIPTIILQRWIFNMRLVYFMKKDEIELCLAQFFLVQLFWIHLILVGKLEWSS